MRFEGRTLAVVQCYNKLGRSGTAEEALAFSAVDEALLRLVAAHAGALLQKAMQHQILYIYSSIIYIAPNKLYIYICM